ASSPPSAWGPSSGLCSRSTGYARWVADRRVVYSSSDGDLRKARDHSAARARAAAGGRVKVRREVAGRRGKGVTTVTGVPLDDAGLRALAGRLKKRCG